MTRRPNQSEWPEQRGRADGSEENLISCTTVSSCLRKPLSARTACTRAGRGREPEKVGGDDGAAGAAERETAQQFPAIIQAGFGGHRPCVFLLYQLILSPAGGCTGAPPQRGQSPPLPGIGSSGAAAFVSTPADSSQSSLELQCSVQHVVQ